MAELRLNNITLSSATFDCIKADVYALGVMFYEVITYTPAFIEEKGRYKELLREIVKGLDYNAFFTDLAGSWDLVHALTKRKLEERLSLQQALSHEFFSDVRNQMETKRMSGGSTC